ncbi:5-formyltetrahydrofolate cyclo-ligase [Commensalibacter sp. Nvir]|uniref:5-formyltetrahydrofolate cyclo-ligase n=1 Tax=Commensalibacter sp. Nvir TaxID=3069817 RepID=UPI002D4A52C0|nr:5-formyltetrahydrofolate cyclo-ligase [Commensalibacter sp. Nvir]
MNKAIHLKKTLRSVALKRRMANAEFQKQHTPKLIHHLSRLIHTLCPKGENIACFWPMQGEIDLRPMMGQLYNETYQILLPKTRPNGQVLTFHLWSPSILLKKGLYGTYYPDTKSEIPDFVVVPLLGFDDQGNRLGYGGGYYDRTLTNLHNIHCAGVACSYQQFEHIPSEKFDYSLPMIVTEKGIIRI